MGILRGRVWFLLWSLERDDFSRTPCERSGQWARKKRQGSFQAWASCQLWQKRTSSSYAYLQRTVCGFLEKQSIRGRLGFETCFTRQILEIPTDWPKKVSGKKLSDFRKNLHVQRLGEVYESQGLVCFLEHRDFDDPGSEDLINEELFWTSGTRRARGMSEDGAGIRTRPIKC